MTGGTPGDAFAERLADLIAAFRAVGREILATPDGRVAYQRANELWAIRREQDSLTAWLRAHGAARIAEAEHMSLAELAAELGLSRSRAQQLEQVARENRAAEFGGTIPASPQREDDMATKPEPQPVVAAIVTSAEGVLVTRRKDARPLWGFVTGEVEPGESPADAAVREVKEETGLAVKHGRIIGRRVHPKTSRTMIYLTAELTGSRTQPFVGDESELAAVFWVDLAEAQKLLPDMFRPVRDYLATVVR